MEETGLIMTGTARLEEYIAEVEWRFAKTYAKTAPHEYTIRRWRKDLNGEFDFFIDLIRQKGYDGRFWGVAYRYLEFEEYKYWFCADEDGTVSIINREPLDLEAWKKRL